LSDELAPASDTSNNVSVTGELDLKLPVNTVRFRVILKEKPNDQSLLAHLPAVENLNVQQR
jgi:hypothetical protein